MNLLISIGCDKYDSLSTLTCAEADAKALCDILTTAGDPYSIDHVILLLSPTTERVRRVLEEAFPLKAGCDSVTFFFAGHGGMAGDSFFLCLSDCKADKLSTTGLSVSSLFTIINDFKPTQVNLVIDACGAGGSTFDLRTLIKSEFTGAATSSSIAFLGACCVDQDASEKSGHGLEARKSVSLVAGPACLGKPLRTYTELGFACVGSYFDEFLHSQKSP
ncbi:MAG: caspase family protein [Methylacidiphilales bacterium]|nr:caspase family protein [Candidatus Methylacidiphilales bacterium]